MENIYDRLKNSPMFNLSLASKELFHSNFLYWVAQKYRKSFPGIISELIGEDVKMKEEDNWRVKREYNNFDLCVVAGEGEQEQIVFVLENKVKSIPQLAQIQKYNEKLKNNPNCKKVLLSLSEEFPDKDKIKDGAGWVVKNYSDLAASFNKVNIEDCYVNDYISFINNLQVLNNKWSKSVNNESKFLCEYTAENEDKVQLLEDDIIENSYSDDNVYKMAKDLRIHDLLGKTRFLKICQDLTFPNGIIARTAFTNGTPILEVMTAADDNTKPNFIIQIQGKQYRHMIAVPVKLRGKEAQEQEAIEIIKRNNNWLSFMNPIGEMTPIASDYGSYCSESGILATKFGMRRKYCKYAPSKNSADQRFAIYRYRTIEIQTTIGQIIECIKQDVENLSQTNNL